MIPNNTWSTFNKPEKFPASSLPKPQIRYNSVLDIKTGGIELSQSNGSINTRYWMVYQDNTNVVIRKALDVNTWSEPTVLFSVVGTISDISLSFDNLGRPVVFYQIGTQLILWFYDSQIGGISFKTIAANGHSPIVEFDYVNDTTDPMSDIMMYYVVNDTAYMRLQRDRFDIEYPTGVSYPELKLQKAGMTAGNRFQVTYTFRDIRDGSFVFNKVS